MRVDGYSTKGDPHWGIFIPNFADTQHLIEKEMYRTFQMSQTKPYIKKTFTNNIPTSAILKINVLLVYI